MGEAIGVRPRNRLGRLNLRLTRGLPRRRRRCIATSVIESATPLAGARRSALVPLRTRSPTPRGVPASDSPVDSHRLRRRSWCARKLGLRLSSTASAATRQPTKRQRRRRDSPTRLISGLIRIRRGCVIDQPAGASGPRGSYISSPGRLRHSRCRLWPRGSSSPDTSGQRHREQ